MNNIKTGSKTVDATPMWKARLALAGGVIALTLSPLFIRWAEAPGIVTSFYRMFITIFLLLPLAFRTKINKAEWRWKFLIFPFIGGIASSMDHSFWSTSIKLTAVANATLLNNISPLWVAFFSWLILKERLGKSFWVGLISVLVGATLVLGSTFFSRPTFLLGDFLALISSVFYAIFFLATSKGRAVLHTSHYLFVMSITAALGLLIATQIFDYPLFGYSLQTKLVFIIAAVVSQFGAYYLISFALGKISASVVTPTMVAQPVLTALLAIPLLGEQLLLSQSLGGLVVLIGIYVINKASEGVVEDKTEPDLD